MHKKIILTTALTISVFASNAQRWVEYMQDPNVNFYITQKEAHRYFEEKEKNIQEKEQLGNTLQKQEESGYQLFQRWERFMEPRVYPSGDVTIPSQKYKEFLKQRAEDNLNKYSESVSNKALSNSWTPVGPMGDMVYGDAGRLNFVRFNPTNNNNAWVGAPAGGLWSSVNDGISWTITTDQSIASGYSDLAIDPTDSQIMYAATGDADGYFSNSIGVLKSIDGGQNWASTGTLGMSSYLKIGRLLIDPNNNQVLIAATNDGIYRSQNAGASWQQVSTIDATDLEFKPGNSGTVYAAGRDFQISTNNGLNWTTITNGVPSYSAVIRLAIAVSPADPDYVYMLAADYNGFGFYGLYLSTNGGTSFNTQSTSPNVLGWSSTGGDTGGQGFYTLSLAVSPTNKNEVMVGGVNIWRSLDAGVSWNISGQWINTTVNDYVHADIHDLVYLNETTIWAATDGGIFYTLDTGITWIASNGSINVSEIYNFGLSTTQYHKIIASYQDCGTNVLNGTSWTNVGGGDGIQSFIDWNNDNNMYWTSAAGSAMRSIGGNTQWLSMPSSSYLNFIQDPLTSTTLWAFGGNQNIVYSSTDQGTNWSSTSGTIPDNNVTRLKVAKSNSQIIYVISYNTMFKTTDGGNSWINITGTLPSNYTSLSAIEIKPTDANTVWVTLSGYYGGNKVYKTTDGGLTWTNISNGLPNLPVNCITYSSALNEPLFVGTDNGVYFMDTTMTSWVAYGTGLPFTEITSLAIFQPTGKLNAATLGRGIWEIDLFDYSTSSATLTRFTSGNIDVFPNPAKEKITILSSSNTEGVITITDLLGKIVKEAKINSNQTVINTEDIQSGVYFIKVTLGNNSNTQKIVISK